MSFLSPLELLYLGIVMKQKKRYIDLGHYRFS